MSVAMFVIYMASVLLVGSSNRFCKHFTQWVFAPGLEPNSLKQMIIKVSLCECG